MNHRQPLAPLAARSAAIMGALAACLSNPRLSSFRRRGGGMMGTGQPTPLPLWAAALATLFVAAALFSLYVHPAHAQQGEAPAQPTGLTATATHDQVTLTWNDPQDDSITGYVILRRNRNTTEEGQFSELAPDTGTAETTYTDDTVEANTPYTFRIKAINPRGESEQSERVQTKTPEAPDPADLVPSSLTAELVDGQVVLGWDAPDENAGSVRACLQSLQD